jgi:hypothetical protein
MFVLPVTPLLRDHEPTVFLNDPNYLFDFHLGLIKYKGNTNNTFIISPVKKISCHHLLFWEFLNRNLFGIWSLESGF